MSHNEQFNRAESLATLVVESRALLDKTGGAVQWGELVERESVIRERLVQVLQSPVAAEEAAAVQSQLEVLLDINREIIARVEGRKAQAFASLEHMVLVRRAAQAYGDAAGA